MFLSKVVISFKRPFSMAQAKSWINTFNESSLAKLVHEGSLINSLFEVSVKVDLERE